MDSSETQSEASAPEARGGFRIPERTNTLQIILGLLFPSAFILAFLKWQRLNYWMYNRAEHGLDDVIKSEFEFTIFERISSWPWRSLDVLKSDFFVLLAFTCVALLLVYAVKTQVQKLVVLVGLQTLTIAFCVLETAIFFYHNRTGANPDLTLLMLFVERFDQFERVVSAEGSSTFPKVSLLMGGFLLVFPWLLRRVLSPDGTDGEDPPTTRHLAGLTLAAVVFTAGAFLPAFTPLPPEVTGNAVLNIARIAARGDAGPSVSEEDVEAPRLFGKIEEDTPDEPPPNVVVIILESTRTDMMSIYDPDEASTTPFLGTLADESVIYDRHYTTVPHTSKALVSILCGIEPHWRAVISEALPGSLPARCLPEMSRRAGYATAFFQTATQYFEDRDVLVENMGYQHFFASEHMPSPDEFEMVNYLGYEENAMLVPSLDWLDDQRERPVFLTYLTVMAHSPYTPPGVKESEGRSFDTVMEHYRETIRYSDDFVREIVEAFRERGLYENTVFVVLSDHGEAFGEHGLWGHNGILYEETMRSAMMIHDPRKPEVVGRHDEVTSHLDLVPTLAELMGYRLVQSDLRGRSLLDPVEDRSLYLHGWYQNRVLGTVDPDHKFIYYFGDRPTDYFELTVDMEETKPLPLDEALEAELVEDILRQRNTNHLRYELFGAGKLNQAELDGASPEIELDIELAPGITLLGLDRPLPFGRGLSRWVNLYMRLEPGADTTGLPMAIRVESNGESLETIEFDLLQTPVQSDDPVVVARAVEVVLSQRHEVDAVDLVLLEDSGRELARIEAIGYEAFSQ